MALKFSTIFLSSNRNLLQSVSRCSLISLTTPPKRYLSDIQKEPNDWRPIYTLPVIRWIAALSKIKLYQAGLTVVVTPITYAAEFASLLPSGSSLLVAALGVTGTCTLFISSCLSTNLIGFIYVNNSQTRLRLAFLDFWGKRKNIECNLNEIEPPSEKLHLGVFSNVKTHDKQSFRLLRRMGHVTDSNIFAHIFGE